MIELAPSILAADFAHLADQIQSAEAGGAALLHLDVMDGHFVPNLTIGPPLVASVRKVTNLPLDCHLMIDNPDQFIPIFADAGADWISVHQEISIHLHRTIELIKHHELLAGVVLNPATPVETLTDIIDMVDYVLIMSVNPGFGGQKFIRHSLKKIAQLATMREQRGLNFRIEVDGGVALDTVTDVVKAGARVLVAGSAVFGGKGSPKEHAEMLIKAATEATWQQV